MVKFTVAVILAAAFAGTASALVIDGNQFSSRDVAEQPDLFGRAAVKVMNEMFSREELSDILGRDIDELDQRDFDELMEREVDIEDDLLTRQIGEGSEIQDIEARGLGTFFSCRIRFLFNSKKRNACTAKAKAKKAAAKKAKKERKAKKNNKTTVEKDEPAPAAAPAEEAREFGEEDLEARASLFAKISQQLGQVWNEKPGAKATPGKPAPAAKAAPGKAAAGKAAPAPAAPEAAAEGAPAPEGGDAAPAAREFEDFEDFVERDFYDDELIEREFDDLYEVAERDFDEGELYERDFYEFDDVAERDFDDEDLFERAWAEYDELD